MQAASRSPLRRFLVTLQARSDGACAKLCDEVFSPPPPLQKIAGLSPVPPLIARLGNLSCATAIQPTLASNGTASVICPLPPGAYSLSELLQNLTWMTQVRALGPFSRRSFSVDRRWSVQMTSSSYPSRTTVRHVCLFCVQPELDAHLDLADVQHYPVDDCFAESNSEPGRDAVAEPDAYSFAERSTDKYTNAGESWVR